MAQWSPKAYVLLVQLLSYFTPTTRYVCADGLQTARMPYIYAPMLIDGRERRRVCSPFAHIHPKNSFIHVVIPLPHKSLKPAGFAHALLGSASQIQPTNPGRSPPRPPHCRKRNKKTLIQRVNSRPGSTFFIVVQTYSGFPNISVELAY